ncbi:hypothetical protein BASA83_012968 [Batrachochytrium salamandrivorans]|nr:hypothetical protein BASA83_012968 [Batrachochytrium salamandrivorans]
MDFGWIRPKISAVQSWPTPKKVRDLQVLLGFTNFYRALIHDYSSMTANLTKLFKKDAPFVWGPEQEKSLQDLKTAFAKSDFLTHPDDSRPFILETDASDYAISGMNSAEQNYEIYDKELLAVVESFKHWRHFLQGWSPSCYRLVRSQELGVLHDDQEINSSSRLVGPWNCPSTTFRLLIDLANLMVGLIHFPVVRTTRSNSESSNFQRILDPSKVVDLQSLVADMDLHLLLHSQVLEKVFVLESDWPLIIADFLAGEDNAWMDDVPEVILERCKRELKHFRFRDNSFLRILEDGKSTAAYVTTDKRVDVMKHYHTSLAHLKYGSIIDLLLRRFWWPSMKKDLKDFIARCPECQLDRSSSGIHAPLPIRPVPPVALPFERLGDRFLWSNGRDQVREQVFNYLHRLCDSMGLGQASQGDDLSLPFLLSFTSLMMTYGAPFEIISDRGKSFLAEGIDLFERENKIRHLATTPYHPQTNGMVERMHAMLGHGLTTLVHGKRDRWDEYLPQVLLALRTRTHAVTGFSPFFLLFGIHPRLPTDETPPRNTLAPLDEIERMEENSEFIARNLEEVGQARSAANVRTKAQSEAMRKRGGFDENTPDYFFKVGDMVKMKHHERLKLEFRWKGPYHVVDVGHPGTYWIMTPQGLPTAECSESK